MVSRMATLAESWPWLLLYSWSRQNVCRSRDDLCSGEVGFKVCYQLCVTADSLACVVGRKGRIHGRVGPDSRGPPIIVMDQDFFDGQASCCPTRRLKPSWQQVSHQQPLFNAVWQQMSRKLRQDLDKDGRKRGLIKDDCPKVSKSTHKTGRSQRARMASGTKFHFRKASGVTPCPGAKVAGGLVSVSSLILMRPLNWVETHWENGGATFGAQINFQQSNLDMSEVLQSHQEEPP